jgi:hypothetical protein
MHFELKERLTHADPDCPGGPVEQAAHKGDSVLECTGCDSILYRGIAT